jgi:hypothetical protein
MRQIIRALAIAAMTSAFAHSPGHAQTALFTADELDHMCNAARGSDDDTFCMAYLIGIETGIERASTVLKAGHGCVPPSENPQTLRAIVLKYIADHPESRSKDGRAATIAALGQAYPCASQASDNATDVCAKRCLPPGGFRTEPGMIVTGLPPSTDACLRTCGAEIGRGH